VARLGALLEHAAAARTPPSFGESGRMTVIVACIEEPDVARKILEHLGLPSEPLPTARAQAPPVTLELFPEAWTSSAAVDDECVFQREPFGPRRRCARCPERAGFRAVQRKVSPNKRVSWAGALRDRSSVPLIRSALFVLDACVAMSGAQDVSTFLSFFAEGRRRRGGDDPPQPQKAASREA
jgi:hypothetical protein